MFTILTRYNIPIYLIYDRIIYAPGIFCLIEHLYVIGAKYTFNTIITFNIVLHQYLNF